MLSSEVDNDPKKTDLFIARRIHFVEKEYGVLVEEDYSYLKLLSQWDYLDYINTEAKKKQAKK